MGTSSSSSSASLCFPRCVSRERDRKWNSQDLNQQALLYGMLTWQGVLDPLCHNSALIVSLLRNYHTASHGGCALLHSQQKSLHISESLPRLCPTLVTFCPTTMTLRVGVILQVIFLEQIIFSKTSIIDLKLKFTSVSYILTDDSNTALITLGPRGLLMGC